FKYRAFVEDLLNCKNYYFLAKNDQSDIIGVFPIMISYNKRLGNVANSLPFYGSNGGIIVSEKLTEAEKNDTRIALLGYVEDYIKNEKCITFTVITNPLDKNIKDWLEISFTYDLLDSRIGQITQLPEDNQNVEEDLMKMFEDPRPRNIRKAIKSGVTWYDSYKEEDLEFLYKTHFENIKAINGIPKSKQFFMSIPTHFDSSDYKIYIAEQNGEKIAALLLFYFNKTVEYFTPAIVEQYRNLQPTAKPNPFLPKSFPL
ncbi:hypothetical protein JYT36_00785, partial [Bacteroidales bacterium AH-315-N07]|nr:hypothetical protein [Bacteroidales bacterium AH-315-N07]